MPGCGDPQIALREDFCLPGSALAGSLPLPNRPPLSLSLGDSSSPSRLPPTEFLLGISSSPSLLPPTELREEPQAPSNIATDFRPSSSWRCRQWCPRVRASCGCTGAAAVTGAALCTSPPTRTGEASSYRACAKRHTPCGHLSI